jgi:Flp pilus assembly protein CpaB
MPVAPVPLPVPLHRALISVRRAVLLRRRLLAATCLGLGIWLGLRSIVGPPPPTTEVLVAAHDLPAGVALTISDLTTTAFAAGTAPAGLVDAATATGRTLAAPLTAGEPVTDVRLVAPSLLEGYPGLVALPLRIPDSDTVALLRVGDRIDVLATDPGGAGTATVAHDAPVLALPEPSDDSSQLGPNSSLSGRLVVVGTTSDLSESVADASVRRFLTVIWSR